MQSVDLLLTSYCAWGGHVEKPWEWGAASWRCCVHYYEPTEVSSVCSLVSHKLQPFLRLLRSWKYPTIPVTWNCIIC